MLTDLYAVLLQHKHTQTIQVAPLLEKVVAALLDPVAAAGSEASLQRGFEESREAMIKRYTSFEVSRPLLSSSTAS
jgi:hypothetical protein